MGFRETDLDDILKNGPRDYPTNDVFDSVLIWWDGGILQVGDQANLGDDNYYTEDSIKIYVDFITYVLRHISGTTKINKNGSNNRGYAETMTYPKAVNTSCETPPSPLA